MFLHRKLGQPVDLLALHQQNPDRYPYLLASNTSGAVNTRWSLLLGFPDTVREQRPGDSDCLLELPQEPAFHSDTELPFVGGWFLFLSYEYASMIEPSVDFLAAGEDFPFPLAWLARIPAAVIVDHREQRLHLVAESGREELIGQMQQDIERLCDWTPTPLPEIDLIEEDPALYLHRLQHTHRYIVDGDIFQANLSRLWQGRFRSDPDPASLYARLRETNPAPFAALIRFDESRHLLSSSPERLIELRDGIIETRPIAGTHPRGASEEEDRALSARMLGHPKERAEHVMLIDLERNDLGRICEPGSIRLDDCMALETYRHVHHIVSSIQGRLRDGISPRQALHAVFPGGTITGCPKVRCMQIIRELEEAPRGAYTGSLGYISDHGRIDFNILIRSMSLQGRALSFRAGAGIVHDSDSERELQETRHKARGLLHALELHH